MAKKPNHICKYSKCTLGENGGRKKYWACNWCDASKSYLSVACCREHYDLYIQEVLDARKKGKDLDLEPERTDISKEEVKKIRKKSLKKVKAETTEELKDYADENGEVNIEKAVEKINEEIESENQSE